MHVARQHVARVGTAKSKLDDPLPPFLANGVSSAFSTIGFQSSRVGMKSETPERKRPEANTKVMLLWNFGKPGGFFRKWWQASSRAQL
jgi:hypothetical protein